MFHRVRMPFGKHKGKLLGDVPTAYLVWLHREVEMEVHLRDAVAAELRDRFGEHGYGDPVGDERSHSHGSGRDGAQRHSVVDVRSAVKSWYREMAMKYHPDRTLDDGSAMKAINHGYERLRELLKVE
jgi:hypothetical protein